MASTQENSTVPSTSSVSLVPDSPASQTIFEFDDSEDDSSIEYLPRQTKSSPRKYLPDWQDGMKWQEIIRLGLSELVEETGLGTPKVELAGSTPVFVWVTTTETFIALPEIVECTLWHVAYQHPHQYNVSDTTSLLSLSDAASLANQVDRDSPNGPYKEIFVTLQTLVRQELQRLQQERLWDNVRMSQVPHDTQNYNHSSARYLFLVLLAQIGSPANLTYDSRKIVVPPFAREGQRCVHQALGETYLVRQALSSGAVTVMYRLLDTKEKVLARLTVDALHEIAKHGIEYDMEELRQWQGLEAWGLSEVY